MNYAGADTSSSRGDGAGVEFWNVLGIRDGERAGCPPGIQRGDMEICLSDGHPAFFHSCGMGSVVSNVVVTVSVCPSCTISP